MIQVAKGSIEESNLAFEVHCDKPWTAEDMRAIARMLLHAAHKVEKDPSKFDTGLVIDGSHH